MEIEVIYEEGQKVRFIPDGTIYDFGYYSTTPDKCVVYNEGECNLQDAFAVLLSDIEPC